MKLEETLFPFLSRVYKNTIEQRFKIKIHVFYIYIYIYIINPVTLFVVSTNITVIN